MHAVFLVIIVVYFILFTFSYIECALAEFSSVSDLSPLCARYGRRLVLLWSIALQTVFGVAVAFAPNFPVYVILRFAVGTTISGVIINAFVLGKTQNKHSWKEIDTKRR